MEEEVLLDQRPISEERVVEEATEPTESKAHRVKKAKSRENTTVKVIPRRKMKEGESRILILLLLLTQGRSSLQNICWTKKIATMVWQLRHKMSDKPTVPRSSGSNRNRPLYNRVHWYKSAFLFWSKKRHKPTKILDKKRQIHRQIKGHH